MLKKLVYMILLGALFSQFVNAATCDNTALYKCQDDLQAANQNYAILQKQFNALNTSYSDLLKLNEELGKNLTEVTAERNRYKALYENSSLDKLAVSDFLSLNDRVNLLYFYTDQRMYSFNETINQIRNDFDAKITQVNTQVNNFFFIVILSILLEIAIFKFNLLKFVVKLKYVNSIYKWAQNSIRQSTKITSIKKFIFVDDDKSKENKSAP
jgi:hypothetical protein